MLKALKIISQYTLKTIQGLIALMQGYKKTLKPNCLKYIAMNSLIIYFTHPCTKIEFITQDLNIHRNTASKYLNQLVDIGLLTKYQLGKDNYHLNSELYVLLSN